MGAGPAGKRLRSGDRSSSRRVSRPTVAAKDEEGRVRLRFALAGEALLGRDPRRRRHAAAALYPPRRRRRRARPARLPDRVRPPRRRGRGADRLAAPDRGAARAAGAAGIERCFVTLHVGAGTFAPVKAEDTDRAPHARRMVRGAGGRRRGDRGGPGARRPGRRRRHDRRCARWRARVDAGRAASQPGAGETRLFVTPGFRFRVVDLLLTNFHLPRSTLFMLVAAFVGPRADPGRLRPRRAERFRFFSYGDACLLDRGRRHDFGFELLATRRRGPPRPPRPPPAARSRRPAFMPVGTAATVKAHDRRHGRPPTGAEIVLGNTYHLMLRPGAERIGRLGGLHRFMRWDGPILTDSGGYQVMSLARAAQARRARRRCSARTSTAAATSSRPSAAVEIQHLLGADHHHGARRVPRPAGAARTRSSARWSCRSRWAERCKAAFVRRDGYGLFGIVQGGTDPSCGRAPPRRSSRSASTATPSAASPSASRRSRCSRRSTRPARLLPADRPRYLMGVGKPADIVGAVARGVDMFDCVLPTRSGRTGQAFTRRGTVNLRNARHADDPRPLDPASACPAARDYSRAYLHHLVRSGEILGADAADLEQSLVLPGPDARPARRPCDRHARGLRHHVPRRPSPGRAGLTPTGPGRVGSGLGSPVPRARTARLAASQAPTAGGPA